MHDPPVAGTTPKTSDRGGEAEYQYDDPPENADRARRADATNRRMLGAEENP